VLNDIPLITGLARFAGSDCSAWAGTLDIPLGYEKQLIAVNCTTDSALTQLEEQLAAPLLRALRQGRIGELMIYPGNQRCYRITRASLRQFWRRRRPLPDILHVA